MNLDKTAMHVSTFAQAVQQVSAIAQARLPEALHGQLQRATALVIHRHVWMDEDGKHAQVLSSDGLTWYNANGHCTCMDAPRAPQGLCKHKLAVHMYRRAAELLHAPGGAVPPAPVPAALPEAPASVNVRVKVGAHECQITLRDLDEERLLQRLEAVLQRYPAPVCEAPKREQASAPAPTPGETPTCAVHGPMKQSSKAPGTFFCSRKNFDGSYCKEKWPKH